MSQKSWSSDCNEYEGKGNFQVRDLGNILRFHVKDVRKKSGYVAFELSKEELKNVMKKLGMFKEVSLKDLIEERIGKTIVTII